MAENSEKTTGIKRKIPKVKKETVIKLKKAQGKEHINHRNNLVQERVVGPDCRCKVLKCYTKICSQDRENIILHFNKLGNKNDQDAYLMSLISSSYPKRHTTETSQKFRMASYSFKIRVVGVNEIPVCLTAFCNIHGVTKGRVRRLQHLISINVLTPKDMRGSHKSNRYKKTPEEVLNLVRNHIESFKTMQSHYSLRQDPNCRYLPEDLTVFKMFNLFLNSYQMRITYMVYWLVFKHEYTLKFGLPRTDTCATCDKYRLKIKLAALEETKTLLKNEHKLHLLKVEKFNEIRRKEKQKAQEGKTMCGVTFDFMQNLPLPHIRTSDVFFSRQLWLYVFGIHNVGKNQVVLNSYLETEGKKGQNDVTTLLLRYFSTHGILSDKLVLISDGCSGQNKNYVMVYFLYCLVHVLMLFKSIKYIFPIRGHTYLPNDQDFSLIGNKKKKVTAEVPDDWNDLMETVRKNPSPFIVDKINHTDFMNIKAAVSPFFLRQSKPAMKLKEVRMLKINKDVPYVQVRYSFTGPWHRIQIRNKRKLPDELQLRPTYDSRLPLNAHKYHDIFKLTQYLSSPLSHNFYADLLGSVATSEATTSLANEVDNEDNSSGTEDN